jgi:hypothetical protein
MSRAFAATFLILIMHAGGCRILHILSYHCIHALYKYININVKHGQTTHAHTHTYTHAQNTHIAHTHTTHTCKNTHACAYRTYCSTARIILVATEPCPLPSPTIKRSRGRLLHNTRSISSCICETHAMYTYMYAFLPVPAPAPAAVSVSLHVFSYTNTHTTHKRRRIP